MHLPKILFLLSLFTLVSCGGNQTSATLEISQSFITGADLRGGMIVLGEGPEGKKFSLSISGSNEATVKLDSGTWNFYAVAWEGGGTPVNFGGTPHCGFKKGVTIDSQNSKVELSVANANCTAGDFYTATNFNNTFNVFGCDIFYQYNKNNDTFTPVTDANMQTYCAGNADFPLSYLPKFSHYRISAITHLMGEGPKVGFASPCIQLNNNSFDLKIPTAKFPLNVKVFRNLAECIANQAPQNYSFLNGIADGAQIFDSKLSTASDTLLLATSKTKRGRSPFMTEIPRILCGTSGSFSDCFSEPALSAHVEVPFSGNSSSDRQIVLKNLNPNVSSCPVTNVMSPSKYFGTDECSVEEGSLKIKPYRNEFICQNSPLFPSSYTIKDIYKKGNYIYVLRNVTATTDKLSIYTLKGKFVNEFDLGNYSAIQVAVNLAGNKIVTKSSTHVRRYTLSGTTLTTLSAFTVPGVDIELTDDGSFYIVANGNTVDSYPWASNTSGSTRSVTYPIVELRMKGSELYVLEDDTSINNHIHKLAMSTGALGTPTAYLTVHDAIQKFELSDNKIWLLDNVNYHYYYKNELTADAVQGPLNLGTYYDSISFANGKIIVSGGTGIHAFVPGSTTNIVNSSGTCSESFVITHGGASETIAFESRNSQTVVPLFRDLFRFVGRRFFTDTVKPFYYFESLSQGEDTTSGGELRRVQEMLSPQALGGFFSEYATCNDVVAAAPFTKNAVFRDETTGENMSFTVSVSTTTENVNGFNCASAIYGACPAGAANYYDLKLDFYHSNGIEIEKMKIKLKCGEQIGTFESYELDKSKTPLQVRREVLVYTTHYDATSRLEKYSLEEQSKIRSEVVKLYKTSSMDLLARSVQSEYDGTDKYASVTELDLENSGTAIKSSRYEIEDTVSNFYSNNGVLTGYATLSFQNIRNDFSLYTESTEGRIANLCMGDTNTNPYAAPSGGCNLRDFYDGYGLSRAAGFDLTPQDMDIENGTNPLRIVPPGVGGVFEITP